MDFINDKEKMKDFDKLSKEEFLKFYSYITSEEYEATKAKIFDDGFFTGGWTRKNLITLANFNAYSMGIEIKTSGTGKNIIDEIMKNGNFGDTEMRKVYENNFFLVILSIDSCIEVIQIINKKSFSQSQSFEL